MCVLCVLVVLGLIPAMTIARTETVTHREGYTLMGIFRDGAWVLSDERPNKGDVIYSYVDIEVRSSPRSVGVGPLRYTYGEVHTWYSTQAVDERPGDYNWVRVAAMVDKANWRSQMPFDRHWLSTCEQHGWPTSLDQSQSITLWPKLLVDFGLVVAATSFLLLTARCIRMYRIRRRIEAGLCERCAYPVARGESRCSECGHVYGEAAMGPEGAS